MLVLRFERDGNRTCNDDLVTKILDAAHKEKWRGQAGIKQWAKETYGATLRSNRWGDWSSIAFKSDTDMNRFKEDFGIGHKLVVSVDHPLVVKFKAEISDRSDEIDQEDSELDWYSLTVGWALANGMTPDEAVGLGRYIRYHTDLG
jgi:hypothetical protein